MAVELIRRRPSVVQSTPHSTASFAHLVAIGNSSRDNRSTCVKTTPSYTASDIRKLRDTVGKYVDSTIHGT